MRSSSRSISKALPMVSAACVFVISQSVQAGTISTSVLAPSSADISQGDFSASGGQYIGWQDSSDNSTSPGGPGQTFTPASDVVMQSLTIKNNGSYGGSISAATWTVSFASHAWGDWWGSPANADGNGFVSYSETFTGDATASGSGSYVTFQFASPVTLKAGNLYAWSVHTDQGWFQLAKSATDVIAGNAVMPGSDLSLAWQQDGSIDRTFYINAAGTVTVSDSEWITDGSESWSNGANWTPAGVPSGAAGTKVTFATNGGAITTTAQIVVDVASSANVPKIVFNKGDGGYLLSGSGSLTLGQGIDVLLGSHQISVPTSVQSNGTISVAAGSSLTIDNMTVPGYGGFTKDGTGDLTVDKLQNCSPTVNGGTLTLKPGNGQADGWMYGITLNNNSTLNVNDNQITTNGVYGNGTLNIGAGGRLKCGLYSGTAFAGTITGAGDLTVGDTSAPIQTNNFYGPLTYTGATTVNSGTMKTNQGVKSGNTLNVNNGAKYEVPTNGAASGVTSISSLNLSGAGSHVELHDNDLVLNYGANPSSYTDTVNKVKSGLVLLGGAGTDGITSAEVDAQTVQGTILAVVDDGDANITGAITSVSGYAIANPLSSVIVKFTWFGDSNLDGIVDGSDYALLDSGFTSGGMLGGWVFGDYDYSGTVDGSDYALIDTGFISQNAVLPEPASLSLLGLASMCFLQRARRK